LHVKKNKDKVYSALTAKVHEHITNPEMGYTFTPAEVWGAIPNRVQLGIQGKTMQEILLNKEAIFNDVAEKRTSKMRFFSKVKKTLSNKNVKPSDFEFLLTDNAFNNNPAVLKSISDVFESKFNDEYKLKEIKEILTMFRNEYVADLKNKLIYSFDKSRLSIYNRTPSQGLQSSFVGNVTLENNQANVTRMPQDISAQQGGDYDGDMLGRFDYQLDKNGIFVHYEDYLNGDGQLLSHENENTALVFFNNLHSIKKQKLIQFLQRTSLSNDIKRELSTMSSAELTKLGNQYNFSFSLSEITEEFSRSIIGASVNGLFRNDRYKSEVDAVEQIYSESKKTIEDLKKRNKALKKINKNFFVVTHNYMLSELIKIHSSLENVFESTVAVSSDESESLAQQSISVNSESKEDSNVGVTNFSNPYTKLTTDMEYNINAGDGGVGVVANYLAMNSIVTLFFAKLKPDYLTDGEGAFDYDKGNGIKITYPNYKIVNGKKVPSFSKIELQSPLAVERFSINEELANMIKADSGASEMEILEKQIEIFNTDPWVYLSEAMTVNVDNAKLLLLTRLGINGNNQSYILSGLVLGFSLSDMIMFFNQKSISDIFKNENEFVTESVINKALIAFNKRKESIEKSVKAYNATAILYEKFKSPVGDIFVSQLAIKSVFDSGGSAVNSANEYEHEFVMYNNQLYYRHKDNDTYKYIPVNKDIAGIVKANNVLGNTTLWNNITASSSEDIDGKLKEISDSLEADKESITHDAVLLESEPIEGLLKIVKAKKEFGIINKIVGIKNTNNNTNFDMNNNINAILKSMNGAFAKVDKSTFAGRFDGTFTIDTLNRFVNDEHFRNVIIAAYDSSVMAVNPFAVIAFDDNVFTALKNLVNAEFINNISDSSLEGLNHIANKYNLGHEFDDYRHLSTWINNIAISDFLKQKHKIFKIQGKEYDLSKLSDSSGKLGRDSFVRFIGNEFINMLHNSRSMKAVGQDNGADTFLNNVKVDTSLMPDGTRTSFIKLASNDLPISSIELNIKNIKNSDSKFYGLSGKELFDILSYYSLIISNGSAKKDSLIMLFPDILEDYTRASVNFYETNKKRIKEATVDELTLSNPILNIKTKSSFISKKNGKLYVTVEHNKRSRLIPLRRVNQYYAISEFNGTIEKPRTFSDMESYVKSFGYEMGHKMKVSSTGSSDLILYYDSVEKLYIGTGGSYSAEDLSSLNPEYKFQESTFGLMTNEDKSNPSFNKISYNKDREEAVTHIEKKIKDKILGGEVSRVMIPIDTIDDLEVNSDFTMYINGYKFSVTRQNSLKLNEGELDRSISISNPNTMTRDKHYVVLEFKSIGRKRIADGVRLKNEFKSKFKNRLFNNVLVSEELMKDTALTEKAFIETNGQYNYVTLIGGLEYGKSFSEYRTIVQDQFNLDFNKFLSDLGYDKNKYVQSFFNQKLTGKEGKVMWFYTNTPTVIYGPLNTKDELNALKEDYDNLEKVSNNTMILSSKSSSYNNADIKISSTVDTTDPEINTEKIKLVKVIGSMFDSVVTVSDEVNTQMAMVKESNVVIFNVPLSSISVYVDKDKHSNLPMILNAIMSKYNIANSVGLKDKIIDIYGDKVLLQQYGLTDIKKEDVDAYISENKNDVDNHVFKTNVIKSIGDAGSYDISVSFEYAKSLNKPIYFTYNDIWYRYDKTFGGLEKINEIPYLLVNDKDKKKVAVISNETNISGIVQSLDLKSRSVNKHFGYSAEYVPNMKTVIDFSKAPSEDTELKDIPEDRSC